ncbi:hypothetical protein [Anditalea andensis]|uniref:Glycosyl transferase family 1 domain-containing protein n=1 Tax=Anditalea andensis TaxID=1048983 RepID=A0A074KTQ9_9BACT|nr:hypothetical protein [Anditalea andensis]KEO72299.1 hypothetical protein EL17_16240 [Anditalea andensis]
MKNLIVLSRSAPPEVCGMSDYCYNVALQLQTYYDKVELGVALLPMNLTQKGGPIIEHWETLLDRALSSNTPHDIMLNYTPTAYQSFGMPISLLKRLKRLKKENKSNRIYVLIHELWNNSIDLKIHHKILNSLYSISGKSILKMADDVAAFTADQKNLISTIKPGKEVHRSIIGTNIIPNECHMAFKHVRKPGQWVVFGLPHTRLWTIDKFKNILYDCHKSGFIHQLIAIGPIDTKYSQQELNIANTIFGKGVLIQTGPLFGNDITDYFLTSEVALVGQNADSLSKSGSFASLAAHGVPVVCEVPLTLVDPPGKYIIRPDELKHELKSGSISEKSQALYDWFWKNRSWEAIGKDFNSWMNP